MFRKIKHLFSKKNPPGSISPKRMRMLLDMLARTQSDEISCDHVSSALAEFAEMQQRGEDVQHLMPLVHQHLEMCPDCRDEYEAVMAALKAEKQID